MADLDLRLDRMDQLPGAMARTAARDVRTLFPESTLITLEGRQKDPLFVSALIHGNETVGWEALKKLQAWMTHHPLPRSLLIFIGNVRAAEQQKRMVPGRPDYNRIWKGGDTPEHALAARVLAEARAARPFAAIDLHNNTGANPLYALVHERRAPDLQLTSLFAAHAMWTRNPPGTLSEALSDFCPAITAECGHSGIAANEEAAFNLILDALHIDHWRGEADLDLDVYRVTGRIEIDPDAAIVFEHGAAGDIELPASLEKWNFFDRPAGSTFARLLNGKDVVRVCDDDGRDVTEDVFRREGDRLLLTRDFTPAMLTVNETAIRADCLGYLMEKA
ncbi:succinylglutamate desuccinylase/aspartoacylase family protein [Hyphobacterium sp. HN65]|uniref:Succinylglutamate desuccinylase/aspartoacylase family protein n=1 Tax=Hyphobacterium lacteum TaxID=3116575 RepID=A0ABU7LS74_9PROT|nr:succinylglutamate desuccinylase/aspartoacylase family protein [Hyphobacterium sp. HN65]MEE2526772.1 succinylglutamate desuccinylase/aspartoacylase family protein [Hyphobacterium sp. HN65]